MLKNSSPLLLALTLWLGGTTLQAQEAVSWESSMEAAQQRAQASNKLVLVHFWAPWCSQCIRMENEVFNQSGVAAQIQANFVPVKLNAENNRALAEKLGITGLPTEVILTPQGQIVDSIRGRMETAQYSEKLSQIAASRPSAPIAAIAQNPSSASNNPSAFNNAYSGSPSSTSTNNAQADRAGENGKYGDNSRNSVASTPSGFAPTANNPSLSASTNQSIAAAKPPYGQTPNNAEAAWNAQPSSVNPNPAYGGMQNSSPNMNVAVSNNSANNPLSGTPPSQDPLVNRQTGTPPGANTSMNAPPVNPSAFPPNPSAFPLALDGYCPVTLVEKKQWIAGDKRWGMRHQGRLYLFAGPEEQKRFFEKPDAYAPLFAGNDLVIAIEQKRMVPGMREFGVTYDNHIYLFADAASRDKFEKNPNAYANQAMEALRASSYSNPPMR